MTVVRRFAIYLLPYWRHLLAVFLTTGLFVLFSSASYWLAASFLQTLFTGNPPSAINVPTEGIVNTIHQQFKHWTALLLVGETRQDTLVRAAIAIITAFFLKNLFAYLQLHYDSFIEQKVIKDLRDKLFSHLLHQDLAFLHARKRGHLISIILNDVETLNTALNKVFTKLVRDPFNTLFLLVLLLIVNAKLTLIALIIVPSIGWIVLFLSKRIKKYSLIAQESIADVTAHLQQVISGIRVVKAFSAENLETDRFKNITGIAYSSSMSRDLFRRAIIPLNEFVGVIILSAILYAGGEMVLVKGAMPGEDFIRFLVLLFALLNPLISLGDVTANIRHAEASGGRIFDLLDSKGSLINNPVKEIIGDFNILEIRDLSFTYDKSRNEVLKNISFTLKRGEHLAIVGKSGSGKSTLVNLIPRFYDPSDGLMVLNGVDIREYDLQRYRSLFGIVTQQVILFHDSISSNIAYGLDDVPLEDIRQAALAANADEFVKQLPDGYNTIVGEEGSLFSGGQRQRIAIARALLRDPEIVILDEATSALDAKAEKAVNRALDTLTSGRTVITVTHNLATVRKIPRIIFLDEGKILAEGTHDELLRTCKSYRMLAEQQTLV